MKFRVLESFGCRIDDIDYRCLPLHEDTDLCCFLQLAAIVALGNSCNAAATLSSAASPNLVIQFNAYRLWLWCVITRHQWQWQWLHQHRRPARCSRHVRQIWRLAPQIRCPCCTQRGTARARMCKRPRHQPGSWSRKPMRTSRAPICKTSLRLSRRWTTRSLHPRDGAETPRRHSLRLAGR